MIMKQKDGKLERLLEKYKILEIVNERKKSLEDEIRVLEQDLENERTMSAWTDALPGYMQRNRDRIGMDYRNCEIGTDFRNDYIGMDYRNGHKFYSSSSTCDDDTIYDRIVH